MGNALTTKRARTITVTRLVLALAVALVLGASLVPGVDARKKGKDTIASVKERVKAQRDLCELLGGGSLTVSTTPFGATITDCEGGDVAAPPTEGVEDPSTPSSGDPVLE